MIMTGLFYSSYQMVCLFLLNIKKKNILEKTRQDNVYLVFYSDNKYMNGSQRSLLVMHGSTNKSSFLSPQSPSEFTNLRPL